VVFDFNGTLSNDEPLLLRLYTDLFRRRLSFTLTQHDYFRRFAGRSDREIVATVVGEHGSGDAALIEELLAERLARYRELVEERSPVEPATTAMVRLLQAHRVPMAIVTGALRPDVDLVLERSGLATAFDVVVAEEDVRRGKPDPEGFGIAMTALGAEPSAALVFEDSLYGILAAKAAGASCIGVVGTMTRHELEGAADAVVDGLGPGLFASVLEGA
jgi:beta-phosphoglucomutase